MPARAAFACCLALALPVIPAGATPVADQVSGWCAYTGTMTADGRLAIAYGGYTVANAAADGLPPAQTVVTCSVESPAQGLPGEEPTLRETVTVGMPGATAVAAATTPPWPLRPVRVCVSGRAVFGVLPPRTASLAETCRWESLV